MGVFNDITEQKRAEEEFRELSRRTEHILESITDAFYALDREWRYTYINERGLHYLQRVKGGELAREGFLDKNMWEVFPELVDSIFYHKYPEAMREQKTVHFETYSPWPDRWVEVHVYPSEEGLSVYGNETSVPLYQTAFLKVRVPDHEKSLGSYLTSCSRRRTR